MRANKSNHHHIINEFTILAQSAIAFVLGEANEATLRQNNFATSTAWGPETRITAKADRPGGVASAKIVSVKEYCFIMVVERFYCDKLIYKPALSHNFSLVNTMYTSSFLSPLGFMRACSSNALACMRLIGNKSPLKKLIKKMMFHDETIEQSYALFQ